MSLSLTSIPTGGEISEEIINQVYPGVWATDTSGRAKNASPVEVKLKEGQQPAELVEQDDVEIVVTNIINPASFLSGNTGEPVQHDCLETIEATYSSRTDLKEDAENWFTDGSSYVLSGKRYAAYAVTTTQEILESGPLPMNTSAQKAEIIALTRALELAQDKTVNIYTDSNYAFGVVHAHGAIWKERGLLNSQGKHIKHGKEILKLLEAVQLPRKVAIMHIKAHQKVNLDLEKGNELADKEAKQAAKREVKLEGALVPDGQVIPEGKPTYTKEDQKLITDLEESYNEEGWAITPQGKKQAKLEREMDRDNNGKLIFQNFQEKGGIDIYCY
ncbi:uncharacterized protein LOC113481655 [Athene cunicularia]|uniref:uncharacterized protein LOC113481655 n=1 Tax=Athene cunicularia TaxID=194338 RepID=UPI000EF6FB59|nr:uncharacterized protein LOC113481655 [Athene cunicularia]